MHGRLAALHVGLALAAIAGVLATLPLSAQALAGGRHVVARPVLLGLLGGRERFDELTGQHTRVGHVVAIWGQGPVSRVLDALGEIPMLGLRTGSLTSRDIALGRGDAYLAEINLAVAAREGLTYIRPMPEMNGHWNEYCAYNSNGSSRGPARSTGAFRKAFARIYLLVHSGPLQRVNAKLRRLGLPKAHTGELAANPVSRVRVVWNPQGYGSPDVPGNSAAAYFPGYGFVDVVANDLYNIGHRAAWEANDRLYAAFPRKPYAIAEWANWGFDEPAFVSRMADFVRKHRRVEFLAYYNGRPGSLWDIATQPLSRATYHRLIVPLGD